MNIPMESRKRVRGYLRELEAQVKACRQSIRKDRGLQLYFNVNIAVHAAKKAQMEMRCLRGKAVRRG